MSTASPMVELGARELAASIASREISPVELVEACLGQADQVEPVLNAFEHLDRAGAIEAARRAERDVREAGRLGPLHGVPVSVKDLIDVADMPARYGTLLLKDNVAKSDAPSVERLRRAGAIILGKTTTSQFGYRGWTASPVHGNTRNPWNPARTPAGSSGGAVASVASGVVPLALGTDGGGSIRSPSAVTGLVGVKATFARVPIWPVSATQTIAHVGPIARSVDDAALLLGVIAGADMRDPFSLYPPMDLSADAPLGSLRVAFSPTLGYARVEKDVALAVEGAVKRAEGLFGAIDMLDDVFPDPADIFMAEFIGGCSARLGDIVDSNPELVDPPLLEHILDFRDRGSDHFTRLLRSRSVHRERVRHLFERYDILLTPTAPCVAWDIDSPSPPGLETATAWSFFTYPFNLAGNPAGSIPCGLSPEGLPVGLQVVAPLLQEGRLLQVMGAIERILDLRLRYPTSVGA